MNERQDRAQARWLIEHKRRLPVAFLVVIGTWAAVFAATAGAFRGAARERLPKRRAAVAALAPAPVEEAKNAAVAWRRAFAVLEELGTTEDEHEPSGEEQLLTREQLDRYSRVFPLAEEAALIEACDWGLDYSRFASPIFAPFPHVPMLRRITALCARRAELAGSRSDWPAVERCAGVMFAAAGHVQIDPLVVLHLIGTSLEERALESMQSALSASERPPPVEAVARLKALVRRRLINSAPFSRSLEGERQMFLEIFDMLGAGEVGPELLRSGGGKLPDRRPPAMNGYMLVAPLESASFDLFMGKLESGVAAWEQGKTSLPVKPPSSSPGTLQGRLTPVAGLLTGTLMDVPDGAVNRLARARTAIAGLAVIEYRVGSAGKWPSSLAEVELSSDERVDPWSATGEPLRLLRLADKSMLVLSAGGEPAPDEERGPDDLAERHSRGKLIGFRIEAWEGSNGR